MDTAEIKKRLIDLEARFERIETIVPKWFSLSDVSHQLKKSRDTIRKYIKTHLEPEKDFKYIGAKIYISRDALFFIRKHYEK